MSRCAPDIARYRCGGRGRESEMRLARARSSWHHVEKRHWHQKVTPERSAWCGEHDYARLAPGMCRVHCMCICILFSCGFRLRAFYECKDVHGTYTISLLAAGRREITSSIFSDFWHAITSRRRTIRSSLIRRSKALITLFPTPYQRPSNSRLTKHRSSAKLGQKRPGRRGSTASPVKR